MTHNPIRLESFEGSIQDTTKRRWEKNFYIRGKERDFINCEKVSPKIKSFRR